MSLSRAEFQRLVADHSDAMYRLAFRLSGNAHDAEDLVQDAYRSAWKSRESYQHGRGDRAWLASILRRRCADQWRRPRLPAGDGLPVEELGAAGEDPLANQFTDEVQQALDQLPHVLREALLLVVVGELTHQEAADLLGIPLGTALSRVSRARQQLREALVAVRR